MSTVNLQMKQIAAGNLLLVLCCVFYFLWWAAAFKPVRTATEQTCAVLLLLAFIIGIAGVVFAVRGIRAVPNSGNQVSVRIIVMAGIILYFLLLLGTRLLLRRQVTTELLLIVGWGMLQFIILDIMYSHKICNTGFLVILCILIVAAVIGSMVCYLVYYHLNDSKRYVDGMIPLITAAVVMLVVTVPCLVRK